MFNLLKKSKIDGSELQSLTSGFYSSHYQAHNIARLQHLDSLGFDLSRKRILELGAGVGDHTLFYLFRNCEVLPVEGRLELVNHIKTRLGLNNVIQINFENELHKLNEFKEFDFVHCYGLLYHLSNPKNFLDNVKNTGRTLLLETCVSLESAPNDINLVEEAKDPTQAISLTGCRPKRTWLFNTLKEYYPFVYLPITQPIHKEFLINWNIDVAPDHLIRSIFIASFEPISNPNLTTDLINLYQS